MPKTQHDLTRTVFAVLFLGMLISLSLWILRPFLGAIVWATMIVVATWPEMKAVQARLGGERFWAVTVMTAALLLVLIVPFAATIGTLVSNAGQIADWAKSLTAFKLPSPPEWLGALPLIGDKAVWGWEQMTTKGIEELARKAAPHAGALVKWFVSQMGSVGVLFAEFLLTVVIAAILYANGERAGEQVLRFGHRLAGSSGENAVRLAAQAIRGVALGVVVTALAQSALGGDRACCGRCSVRGRTHHRHVHVLNSPGGCSARADSGGDLALLERRGRLGNVSSGRDDRGRHRRQYPSCSGDHERRESSVFAGVHRRHRRHHRLWLDRYFCWAGCSCSRIHPA